MPYHLIVMKIVGPNVNNIYLLVTIVFWQNKNHNNVQKINLIGRKKLIAMNLFTKRMR